MAKGRSRSRSSSGSGKDDRRKKLPVTKTGSKAAGKDADKKSGKRQSRSRSASSRSGSSGSSGSSSSGSSRSGSSSSTGSGSRSSTSRSSKGEGKKRSPLPAADAKKPVRRSKSRERVDKRSTSKERLPQRQRTPTPVETMRPKLFVSKLTFNVTKEHVQEIFGKFGKIRDVIMPMNHDHPHVNRNIAYVEYETLDDAHKAVKYMNGGQIDGQSITVVFSDYNGNNGKRAFGGRFGSNRGFGGGFGGRGFGGRGGRRSPPRRSRSRSPRYGRG